MPRPFLAVNPRVAFLASASMVVLTSNTLLALGDDCVGARSGDTVAALPRVWREAVAALIHSTSEPGHPWSCAGGTIDLTLEASGAILRVERPGDSEVSRAVALPADIVPLGQALLATPLLPPETTPSTTPPTAEVATGTQASEPATQPSAEAVPSEQAPRKPLAIEPPAPAEPRPHTDSEPRRKLLLGAGIDGRAVGGSGVFWLGPMLTAGLSIERWVPSISFRQQSDVISHRPTVDEVSVAIAVLRGFTISSSELRLGPVLRAAAVQRNLPERRGEQSRLGASIGALACVALPLTRWANLVFTVDADFVVASRQISGAMAQQGDETPTAFPAFTLGGSAGLELPL